MLVCSFPYSIHIRLTTAHVQSKSYSTPHLCPPKHVEECRSSPHSLSSQIYCPYSYPSPSSSSINIHTTLPHSHSTSTSNPIPFAFMILGIGNRHSPYIHSCHLTQLHSREMT